MGLFDSPKIFKTSDEIKRALFALKSLDGSQRAVVFEKLKRELDDGGVSVEELKRVVRELRAAKEISEIDERELLSLIDGV